MRRSLIWFLLALAWGLDCVLSISHRNWLQGSLTALFAGCFLVIGLYFRKRERTAIRRNL